MATATKTTEKAIPPVPPQATAMLRADHKAVTALFVS